MKIVVGVDGSEPAGRALKWCASYAKALDAEIVAVHAIDLPVIASSMNTYVPILEFSDVDRDKLRAVVTDEWCAPLAKAGVPFRVVLKDGDPAFTIMQVARDEEADLVVTGRRGRGGFAELLLGSTSYALTHHLNRPLLVLP